MGDVQIDRYRIREAMVILGMVLLCSIAFCWKRWRDVIAGEPAESLYFWSIFSVALVLAELGLFWLYFKLERVRERALRRQKRWVRGRELLIYVSMAAIVLGLGITFVRMNPQDQTPEALLNADHFDALADRFVGNPELIYSFTPKGKSLLMVAMEQGDLAAVKWLLEQGADLHASDALGLPTLFYALDNLELMQFLLPYGANLSQSDPDGMTLIHYAVKRGNMEMIQLLVEFGADVNARNNQYQTPLMMAVGAPKPEECIRLLVTFGADVNLFDRRGDTALHKAAFYGRNEEVRLLLEFGADPAILNLQEMSALHVAVENGFVEVVTLFLEHEPTAVNDASIEGYAPIYYACMNGDEEMIDLLLDRGANINQRMYYGAPLLELLVERKRYKAVERLMRAGANIELTNLQGSNVLQLICAEEIPALISVAKELYPELYEEIDSGEDDAGDESPKRIPRKRNTGVSLDAL